MTEQWKDITGYEGRYQISELGQVKSLARWVDHSINGKQFWPERIMKQRLNRGYLVVNLGKNSKKFTAKVHRLVAEAFIENPDNLPEVNHLDGNKANPAKTNLEWSTGSGNSQHAFKIGLCVSPMKKGAICNAKKLDSSKVPVIRDLYNTKLFPHSMLASMFGVSKFLIWNITSGRKKISHVIAA